MRKSRAWESSTTYSNSFSMISWLEENQTPGSWLGWCLLLLRIHLLARTSIWEELDIWIKWKKEEKQFTNKIFCVSPLESYIIGEKNGKQIAESTLDWSQRGVESILMSPMMYRKRECRSSLSSWQQKIPLLYISQTFFDDIKTWCTMICLYLPVKEKWGEVQSSQFSQSSLH